MESGLFRPWGFLTCLPVPGKIAEISDTADIRFRVGKVDLGGTGKEVDPAYTPEATVGKYVLVHVGFAISVIDGQEAQRVFQLQLLEEMGAIMGAISEELGEIPR